MDADSRHGTEAHRIEVIAEIANAHDGDPAMARELARQAVATGADAVKFQVYTASELLTSDHPRFAHFSDFEFPREFWREAVGAVQSGGCRAYCDVFGVEAFEIALGAGADGVKVHASDLRNAPLLDRIADAGLPVFVSVGGARMTEIAAALRVLRRSRAPITLLHGFQAYPTAPEDAGLSRLQWLRDVFGKSCRVGYMDHADADTIAAWTLPAMAVALGADVIEKHITLDRRQKGTDYYSSLNPDEFTRFIEMVRQAERAVWRSAYRFSSAEREYSLHMGKRWVAAQPLRAGDRVQQSDLVMKRAPGAEFCPDLDQLLGRRLARNKSADEPVRAGDVSQHIVAMVVARMRSARLPGKATAPINEAPALAHLFRRLGLATSLTHRVLCTTTNPEDDVLAELAREHGLEVVRGETSNVLQRMIVACDRCAADIVLRITGDDILVDPFYLDASVRHHLDMGAEYTSAKALPGGTEVEVFNASVLRAIASLASDPEGTEYLTLYVRDHADQFRCTELPVPAKHRRPYALSIDTDEDLETVRALLAAMARKGKPIDYSLDDIVEFMDGHPDMARVPPQRPRPEWVSTQLEWSRL